MGNGGGGKCGSDEWEWDDMLWLLKGVRAHNLLNGVLHGGREAEEP